MAAALKSNVIPSTDIAAALGLIYYEGGQWDRAKELEFKSWTQERGYLGKNIQTP